MATTCNLGTQAVIAFDIGLGLAMQGQCLRRVQWWPANHLAVDQAVQQVQHMGFGRHALGQRQFHGGQHSLLIVVQDKGEDIDHLPVPAGLAQHVILQLPERRR